ncbi:MAG: 50S ribosomal protein L28 [Bacteroidales bacterium]|jgi:large subunit ribosomal protein L28|nr:50S ribosomal protein L28 [Bacteroidales bacterium]
MSRVCDLTGKRFVVGNKVSHSNRKTLRKFNVNLQMKKFYVPEWDEWIWLRVSMDALRSINKKGVYACLKEAEKKGLIKLY